MGVCGWGGGWWCWLHPIGCILVVDSKVSGCVAYRDDPVGAVDSVADQAREVAHDRRGCGLQAATV